MTKNEKEALLTYIEFHLVKFCEQIEDQIDPNHIGDTYSFAYNILNDLESTIEITNTTKKI